MCRAVAGVCDVVRGNCLCMLGDVGVVVDAGRVSMLDYMKVFLRLDGHGGRCSVYVGGWEWVMDEEKGKSGWRGARWWEGRGGGGGRVRER